MDVLDGHAALTCTMDMQYGIQYGHAVWTGIIKFMKEKSMDL
jgi:hypothetical protein